jgi:hypothetical protein
MILLAVQPGWGWGRDGHRLVAKIAALKLNAPVRAKLAVIFNVKDDELNDAMADAATWPDEINKKTTGSRDWHFIDVPVTSPFSLEGLCGADGDCVTFRIKDFAELLRTNQPGFHLLTKPKPFRPVASQEVAFLIHFVGDIHQPLHSATNGDRGGNCVNLAEPIEHSDASQATTELHALWDVDTVLAVYSDLDTLNPDRTVSDEDHVAADLFADYQKAAPGAWEKAGIEDWAKESNDLAKSNIYQKLSIPAHTAAAGQCATGIDPVTIDDDYLDANVNITEQQLTRAGVRLANLLNDICGGKGCAAGPAVKPVHAKK